MMGCVNGVRKWSGVNLSPLHVPFEFGLGPLWLVDAACCGFSLRPLPSSSTIRFFVSLVSTNLVALSIYSEYNLGGYPLRPLWNEPDLKVFVNIGTTALLSKTLVTYWPTKLTKDSEFFYLTKYW